MEYDPNVPRELKSVQEWFGGVITQPIDKEGHIDPKEAQLYLSPSPTLKPEERIEIYNQQYWWRLLSILHDTFPLATRLLGYRAFNNRIAVPYLSTYRPDHWSLVRLGDRLPIWMEGGYQGDDKELLLDAISVDAAFNASFFAAQSEPLTAHKDPEEIFTSPAFLQPHVSLFHMDYDLFRFRNEIKQKDPDFWSNHHHPSLKHALSENSHHFPKLVRGKYFFIIYRCQSGRVHWDDLSEEEYFLLSKFKSGTTIEMCCESLEEGASPQHIAAANAHLKEWIEKWISKEWLAG